MTEEINHLNLTLEECFILGRYIADGHTRKDFRKQKGRENERYYQLVLSIGESKETEFALSIKDNNYNLFTHSKSVKRFVFSKKRLVEIAEEHCGVCAINKKISPTLLDLPKEHLSKLLDGYRIVTGKQIS